MSRHKVPLQMFLITPPFGTDNKTIGGSDTRLPSKIPSSLYLFLPLHLYTNMKDNYNMEKKNKEKEKNTIE